MENSILGVRIDPVSERTALQKAKEFLSLTKHNLIFTPNPEMVVKAQTDSFFKEVLNSSDLNLCDGVGLFLACKIKKLNVHRITGVDFMLEVCKMAEKDGRSVFLLGSGDDETLKRTGQNLLSKFPMLKIVGINKGPFVRESANSFEVGEENEKVLTEINNANPDILFVAFGMGKQEKWLKNFIERLPSVKIGMGVGGAFDYISEKIPRAPLLLRKIGLEWAYRLLVQPERFQRIFNATVAFSFLFIKKFRD